MPRTSANPFDELSAEEIRAHRDQQVLLRLLTRVQQIELGDLVGRLEQLGYSGVGRTAIGFLANIDTEGTRIVTVANRTGTTRQAVSQLAADLEAKGHVERVADPDDGRAVLVRHTTAGRQMLNAALQAMADIEAGYEAVIGPRRMKALKEALRMIADAADPSSALGEG